MEAVILAFAIIAVIIIGCLGFFLTLRLGDVFIKHDSIATLLFIVNLIFLIIGIACIATTTEIFVLGPLLPCSLLTYGMGGVIAYLLMDN